jgi:hypothetical protein
MAQLLMGYAGAMVMLYRPPVGALGSVSMFGIPIRGLLVGYYLAMGQ